MGVDVREGKAPAGALELVVGGDGVLQAAGLPHYGDSAVAHSDHLAQAAGLADRGHEEQVRAGVNGGGQRRGIGDLGGKAAGILDLRLTEGGLILPVSGAQDHHLHIHGHDLVEGISDQGESLVAHQAGDAGDDGHVGVLLQAHGPLEGQLALGLPLHQGAGAEVGGQPGGGGGVIELGIDAVEDALELSALLVDDPGQAVGIEGQTQLLGVGGRDGGDEVGGHDGALH